MRIAPGIALGALVLASTGDSVVAEPKSLGTVTTVQLPRQFTVMAAKLADVDGDGGLDLLVGARRRGGRGERTLRVHLRRAGTVTFVAEPDLVLDVPEDVTAFTTGDVQGDPGREVVLFTATAAGAWRPRAAEDARFVKIAEATFLWQLPDPHDLLVWSAGVRDVDGDGLDDLVLPEPDGWRSALQRRDLAGAATLERVSAPRAPRGGGVDGDDDDGLRLDSRSRRREVRIALAPGEASARPGELLDVTERVPAPIFEDRDGDGRVDLLAQTTHALHVWRQRPDGTFPPDPDEEWPLPVVADRSRRLDVSYQAHAADLDGDRRVDAVFLAGDRRSDDVRTQVLVFTQSRDGSFLLPKDGVPRQLLVVAGFAGAPRLDDVDGDGRPDLVLGALRVDAIDAVRAAAAGTLDAELYVYLNRGGRFSEAPDVRFAARLAADGLRHARSELVARFFGDVTGDGVRDLLLREEPERVRVLMTRRSGKGLTVVDTPLWETRIGKDASVVLDEPAAGAAPEMLVVDDAEVLHVRFR